MFPRALSISNMTGIPNAVFNDEFHFWLNGYVKRWIRQTSIENNSLMRPMGWMNHDFDAGNWNPRSPQYLVPTRRPTCHTACETMDSLRCRFGEQFIFRRGPCNSKCLVDKQASIEALEAKITKVIHKIPIEVLQRVIQNWCLRMAEIRRSCGQHLIPLN
ncbi:uncharacterized protein LOC128871925 isoform X2 [Anastrepha ludens]|uniref:uncharacterized protein LOC128871925 isoform X2 n=1 Tax=Anastrepha ludens TaxID=28586 RepID=UPI0023B1CA05|nr:uncharacterized protein LOC128871925 isoform X2 [Anastrepha ludens]